jgi:prolyl 4-hydroxylase
MALSPALRMSFFNTIKSKLNTKMPPLRSLLTTVGGLAVLHSALANSDHEQQAPLTGSDYVCEHPPYRPLIVSKSPLVIYLQNFITPSERTHLLNLG